MILSLVLKFFAPKRTISVELVEMAAEMPAANTPQTVDRESIVKQLRALYAEFLSKCSAETMSPRPEKTWAELNRNKVTMNANGSYLIVDDDGRIVKTGDVLRRLKIYQYEEGTGELMVKKFGVWNKVNGSLTDNGTLISQTIDGQTHECLDGTLIYISVTQKSLIAQNEQTGEEIALNLQGTLRHRYKIDGVDKFRLYENGILITESESFEEPQEVAVTTMAEELRLESVNRIERKFENAQLVSDSYSFLDARTGSQAIRLCLNLPTGELHLSKVQKLENIYVNGELRETLFELSEPVSISRDKEGTVSLIRGISKVRRFQMHGNVCAVVFMDHAGEENLFFPAV